MSKAKQMSAFPVPGTYGAVDSGMTLRDWFAGQALAGSDISHIDDSTAAARHAYALADAMLAERSK